MSSTSNDTPHGYYRFPTIHQDRVVFVAEDDLWEVATSGGVARRLTTGLGHSRCPVYSPDGAQLAFIGEDEGVPEVYVMPSRGGAPRRLTYDGHFARVVGWSPDGRSVIYSSDAHQPFARVRALFSIDRDGGEPQLLPYGPGRFLSYGPGGGIVLSRLQDESAYWKRYRGGTAGVLWIDADASGEFVPLIELQGNLVRPLWVGERIFFVSDHEGIANLYACAPDGRELTRHTHHDGFYVRNPTSDGQRIVYHVGAELWVYELAADTAARVEVEFTSPRTQRARRFADASDYLEFADLHPKGHSIALTARGDVGVMGLWEGAVRRLAPGSGVRHRLASYLNDGNRLVLVSDEGGEEAIEIHHSGSFEPSRRLDGLDIGRPLELLVSPTTDQVAFSNHRNEVVWVDLDKGEAKILDRSPFARISGLAWAPDGGWLAYAIAETENTICIKVVHVASGEVHAVTRSEFRDVQPSFDPKGRFLYFLSFRDFDPVYDHQSFDLGFPRGMNLCLVTLKKDTPSPFIATPKPLTGDDDADDADDDADDAKDSQEADASADAADKTDKTHKKDKTAKKDAPEPVVIEFDGIADRVLLLPHAAGRFGKIAGTKDRIFFTQHRVRGTLHQPLDENGDTNGTLKAFKLKELEFDTVMHAVDDFSIGRDGKTLLVVSNEKLRAIGSAHTSEKDDGKSPSRKTGWVDVDRFSVEVVPGLEWRQMLREAWRLMRDHFWTADMSGVDWEAAYARYAPLVSRAGSRSELSDIVWEMQGELGTSHAYEFGGDYRDPPDYAPGLLGASVCFDAEKGGYRIEQIVTGDAWDARASSPLARAGIDVQVGDVIVAIDGTRVARDVPLQALLVNKAAHEVELTLAARAGEERPRPVTVKTLRSDTSARYRDWVLANRRRVHAEGDGRIGYVHIPNMGPWGFSEFFRGYLAEVSRGALIVDVRFNGGGHVSPLLLEKLARRRLGYDIQRWGKPTPYPPESVLGPIVALTNEQAGSDGDIFCHAFKMMSLGTLIGKRTWGGVIGIWPRHHLVDGSMTSQPEFSFWFEDVGWGVENYGTEPDIEIDIAPQDYAAGRDPQLARAIAVALEQMAERPLALPDFEGRPSRRAPWQS